MSSAAVAADNQPKIAGLSTREIQLAVVAWRAIDSGDAAAIKFDYNKLAEAGGFKNANSARANFHSLKTKLFAGNFGDNAAAAAAAAATASTADKENATPSSAAKKTPRGRKREKEGVTADGADVGGDSDATPTKKPRKTPVKKGKAAVPAAATAAAAEDDL